MYDYIYIQLQLLTKLVQNQFLINLRSMRQNRKNWSQEEDEAIVALVRKFGIKRWTMISQKMRERFMGEGRSGKQCRERWHNHLSPVINKEPWSQEEIKIVFESHRKFGNKWTQIAQLLQGRTDNAVKNQFYSTLRKGLRRICKILGTRNSTTRIKKIKPTALSNLISNFTQIPVMQGQNQQQLYDLLFQFSNGDKYEELKQKQVNEKNKEKMEKLLQKILDSKENGRKRKNKEFFKQGNNQDRNLQAIDVSQKKEVTKNEKNIIQRIKTKSQIPEQKQQQNNFNFDINLDNEPQAQSPSSQYNDPNLFPFHPEQCDSKLDKPISLKKQNSFRQQQQNYPYLKKKSSQNYRRYNPLQMEIQNNQNYLKCFLSKSPSYCRFKMPTPRGYDGGQVLGLGTVQHDEVERFCSNFVEELKSKIDSKLDKQRIR